MADPAYKAGVAQRSRRRSNPVLHACRPGRYLKSLCDVWIGPIARDPITGREATFSADHPRSCVACIRALVADQPDTPACSTCNGSGVVPYLAGHHRLEDYGPRPCPDCADVPALVADQPDTGEMLRSIDDLLPPEQQRALTDDLARMSRQRRAAENAAGAIPLAARALVADQPTGATPIAWTSQDGIDNLARTRAEGRGPYDLRLRVDGPTDYDCIPLYTETTP